MRVIENAARVRVMEGKWDAWSVVSEIAQSGAQEDPFYVLDLGVVVEKFREWKTLMPRVEPFYAVKCNDSNMMLTTLAALGTGFDCASKAEMNKVLELGVRPERIIFANPAKPASHIRHAATMNVQTMTFDSQTELLKIKQLYPTAKLVVRIRCDAQVAQCPLGMKFGCDAIYEAPGLLKQAAVLGLEVIGVSFHVGSGCGETAVFARGIAAARDLFEAGERAGHRMRLLDIGGGFPGHTGSSICEISQVVNAALERHFPEDEVQVIAEPGRFFAAAAYTLACNIHAKREILHVGEPVKGMVEGKLKHTMYFINDGVYGSFNCTLYDHQVVTPQTLEWYPEEIVRGDCSVWGPTCDGLDCVVPSMTLPARLPVGSWLVFADMGAYTLPVASTFNGFPLPAVRTVADVSVWMLLREQHPFSEDHFQLGGVMTGPQIRSVEEEEWVPPPPRSPRAFVECALK